MTLPVLSREQVRDVDRRAIQQYGMSGLVLMENAGRGCVDKLFELGIDGPVVICCGKGNNAGDGFVIARHLDLRGAAAKVLLWSDPAELQGDAATNFRILEKTDVPIVLFAGPHDSARLAGELAGVDWIVDGLLGTGARGEPRPPLDAVIDQLNACTAKKLAIDLPSGLDCDTGQPAKHTFRADHTCTIVAAKPGFFTDAAKPYVGQIHVLDIGAPRKLIEEILGS
jgi:NAD(P)H-hydrate epimerase